MQSLWWAHEAGLRCRPEDDADLTRCYDVLLGARVALHRSTERPGDVLRLEDQDAAAAPGAGPMPTHFMAARGGGPDGRLAVRGELGPGRPRARAASREAVAPGVVLVDGEIELAAGADPANDQTLVLRVAIAAARTDARIGRAQPRPARTEMPQWPGPGRSGAIDMLVALLLEGHRAIPVLEALDQRDLVVAPAARVGAGSLQAAAQRVPPLHRRSAPVGGGRQRGRARRPGRRPDLLVLGALLHDIGKGYPGDHTEVGMAIVRDLARGSDSPEPTSRSSCRWWSTICCCPTSRCAAT